MLLVKYFLSRHPYLTEHHNTNIIIAYRHPPHIMREFMPILSKFGDLEEIDNLKVSYFFFVHEQINLIGIPD